MSRPEGLGAWIAYLDRACGGNVDKIIALCNRCGISWLAIKSGNTDISANNASRLTQWIPKLHKAGLRVYTWSYCYPRDFERQSRHIGAVLDLGADGHILDPETEWERPDAANLATELMEHLRQKEPNAFIAYAPFDCPDYHPLYPFRQFSDHCDAILPQTYWTEHDDHGALPTLLRSERQMFAGNTSLPTTSDYFLPVGVTYGRGMGWGKPPGLFRVTDLADFIERYADKPISLYSIEAGAPECWSYLERLHDLRQQDPTAKRLPGV